MTVKRDELFEVHEPPPHGLTRLRVRMEERRASRILRPALVLAMAAAAVTVVLWPRAPEQDRVDFTASVANLDSMSGDVMGLGETAIEPMKSTNPKVVLVRAMPAP
jgi:hypothetical protein